MQTVRTIVYTRSDTFRQLPMHGKSRHTLTTHSTSGTTIEFTTETEFPLYFTMTGVSYVSKALQSASPNLLDEFPHVLREDLGILYRCKVTAVVMLLVPNQVTSLCHPRTRYDGNLPRKDRQAEFGQAILWISQEFGKVSIHAVGLKGRTDAIREPVQCRRLVKRFTRQGWVRSSRSQFDESFKLFG